MAGKAGPAGPALYPECAQPGNSRGPDRHHRDGTVPCVTCRETNRVRSAVYRKRRVLEGRLLVDARGSQRRIRAMMRIGWPMIELEKRWGMGTRTLSQVIDREQLTRAKAEKIRVGYDRLAYLGAGPSERTRAWAERRGWAGPMDWDDIDLDPDIVPGYVVERDHTEALAAHREYRKVMAKREKRARDAAEQRVTRRGVAA